MKNLMIHEKLKDFCVPYRDNLGMCIVFTINFMIHEKLDDSWKSMIHEKLADDFLVEQNRAEIL